jgi:hypothetical protein
LQVSLPSLPRTQPARLPFLGFPIRLPRRRVNVAVLATATVLTSACAHMKLSAHPRTCSPTHAHAFTSQSKLGPVVCLSAELTSVPPAVSRGVAVEVVLHPEMRASCRPGAHTRPPALPSVALSALATPSCTADLPLSFARRAEFAAAAEVGILSQRPPLFLRQTKPSVHPRLAMGRVAKPPLTLSAG